MADSSPTIAEFAKQAALIRAAIESAPPFAPTAETATAIQVERGGVFAAAQIDPMNVALSMVERLIRSAGDSQIGQTAIVDATGHHRPVYRGLLVYSWLRAFGLLYEQLPRSEFGRWEEGLRPWCDLLEADLGQISLAGGSIPAARGSSAAEAAWIALALNAAGKIFIRDAWTDLAADVFGKLTRAQTDSGAFLAASSADNLETHTYDELVILHAAASFAVQMEDRNVAAAVARSTQFHLQMTQPDHATAQPWGLFAFIWNEPTRPLADQMLHAAALQPAGASLLLLADALYCLNLFLK